MVQRVGTMTVDTRSTLTTPAAAGVGALEKDFKGFVSWRPMRAPFVEFDPEHTVIRRRPTYRLRQVIRKAGTEIRAAKTKLSRSRRRLDPDRPDPRCGASAQTWPVPSTLVGGGSWWRTADAFRRPVSARRGDVTRT